MTKIVVRSPAYQRLTPGKRPVYLERGTVLDWPDGEDVPRWARAVEVAAAPAGEEAEQEDEGGGETAAADRPVTDLPRIGEETGAALAALDITTVGEFLAVAETDPQALVRLPGITDGGLVKQIAAAREMGA
jgi:hypothetical protein